MEMDVSKNSKEYFLELSKKAFKYAKDNHHGLFLIEHILYTYLQEEGVKMFFEANDYNYKDLLKDITEFLHNYPLLDRNADETKISPEIELYTYFYLTSIRCNKEMENVNPRILNFLFTISSFLFMENTYAERILNKNGITFDIIIEIYQKYNAENIIEKKLKPFIDDIMANTPIGEMQKNKNVSPIERFTINLTEKVKKDDWIKIVGRQEEIDLLQQIILRHDKPNAILVGNPGIGKTKIVEGFAYNISKEREEITVYQLDMLAFMSNIMVKGELENRVKSLTEELIKIGNCILYIDEIHSICSEDGQNMNVANLLKPMLSDNKLKVIGSTTFEEYRKYIEKDEAFTRRFYKMVIEDPTYEETRNIIEKIKPYYEKYFDIDYTENAVDEIMNLTNKFIFDKHYPDKAIDILDMTGAYCKHNAIKVVEPSDVQKVISKMRKIPLSNISQSEEDIYKHLQERLKEKIFGQDEAVEAVSNAVIISRSGLRETSKTAVTLMLKGASGTGKTEICKQLSEIMSIPLIRFDMSEYMEEHTVSKLIGSPPGYKDSGNGKAGNGLLINAIDENPHCVLLLDEIEKAHSKVHNLLLQVMDNGKLTSSMGKQVSFENVFLIMTSNVGSYNAHKHSIGFGNDDESVSERDYEQSFLPEFRNRIDQTITFKNLDNDVMKKICIKFMTELGDMLKEKKINFRFDMDIVDYIVRKALKEDNGAREMKHIITNEIKNVIAKNIVFGEYKDKNKIMLSYKNDKIDFA